MRIIFALISMAGWSSGEVRQLVQPASTARKSYEDIVPVAKTHEIKCGRTECTITWEPKNGAATPVSAQKRSDDYARMKSLAQKWKNDTITAAEKDELLRLFIVAQLASD